MGKNNSSLKKNERSFLAKIFSIQEVGILIPAFLLILLFYFINPAFLSIANVLSVIKTLAFFGIIAVGETLTLLSGDFDISVGSVAGLGAVLSGILMLKTSCLGFLNTPYEWIGVIGCIIITMAICSIVGFINGYLVVDLKLPAFVATIGTMWAVRGFVMVVTGGKTVYPLPQSFLDIGNSQIPIAKIGDTIVGISMPFILFIILIIVFEILLRNSIFGRSIYATGSNKEVAKLSGINTRRVRYINYVILAMLAALSGVLVAAYMNQGHPVIGEGWEMLVIAGCSIGGVALGGGYGSMIGTLIGIFIMNIVNNGLVIVGLNSFLQQTAQGVIILIAVYIDILRRNQKIRA
ncbi:MAG: ABC transporter permease [Actinobacteria bacterium]|nr:ABC transporter permease [Actinomycetota bacterium]